jgi:hypothetical protein
MYSTLTIAERTLRSALFYSLENFMRIICLMSLVLLTTAAMTQQSVAPPPKPPADGPSLEVTMKFIQEKLNGVGTVNFAAYTHDNADNTDFRNRFSEESSNVVADPASCKVTYHYKAVRNGTTMSDGNAYVLLQQVLDLVVMPTEQALKKANIAHGNPQFDTKVDPPMFTLVVRVAVGQNQFSFSDEDTANRVAKAFQHAVELCGGGSKPEPF